MDKRKSCQLLPFKRSFLLFLILVVSHFKSVQAEIISLNDSLLLAEVKQVRENQSAKIDSLNKLNKTLKEENRVLHRANLTNELTIENRDFLIFCVGVFSLLALFLAFRLYITIQKAKLSNKILKLQNLEIAQQKKSLEELNRLKIKFFSIISHDIRSPLLSLKGVLNLYHENLLNDKTETTEFFKHLKFEFSSTSHLLDNLLIWAKKQMYAENIEKIGLPINVLIKENIELQRAKIINGNIAVFNLLKDDIYVFVDKEMINMVIRNLLTNALKFTDFGGKITFFYKLTNNHVEIGIRDTGVGISEDQINMILDTSFYSTAGVNNERGNGLGLMLCREFIEKSDGKLWIESKLGTGSTFFFTLPLFKIANENLQRNTTSLSERVEPVI